MLKPVPVTNRLQLPMRAEIRSKTTGCVKRRRSEFVHGHLLVSELLRMYPVKLVEE